MSSAGFNEVTLAAAQSKGTKGGQYEFERYLGRGAFGTVFLAKDTEAGKRRVAVKMICTGGGGMSALMNLKSTLDEAKTLLNLRHGNIVGFEQAYQFTGSTGLTVGIVTEFCPNGNLNDHLVNNCPAGVPVKEQMKFMRQLAMGVEFIHIKGFTHRDLKPDNILLDSSFNIKIADFGLAKAAWDVKVALVGSSITLGQYMTTTAGTKSFMAPEVLDEHYTDAADIFSAALVFACTTHPEMFRDDYGGVAKIIPLARKITPIGVALHENSTLRSISGCDVLGIGGTLRQPLCRLFDQMLQYDYRRRPSAADVLATLKDLDEHRRLPVVLDTAPPPKKSSGCC